MPSIADHAALQATFENWYAQYYAPISHYIARMLSDRSQAEDVTQEAFFRLWHTLETKGDIEHPQSYLYRIAANLCCDHARRKQRIHWQPLEEDDRLHESAMADPQDHYGTREQVRQTLERMPRRYRVALLLYEKGYSYKQLAEALGISPTEAAVKMYLTRARHRFRQCYSDLS